MSNYFDKSLKIFSLSIIFIICITGVYSARGLYADGAFWLVEMLPRNGFYIFDPHREFAQRIVQLPIALAIWFGILDLNFLIRLQSFCFIGIPLIFWVGALCLHFRSNLFWFFLIAFTVSFLRTNFFAVSEFNSSYGMTAFCAAILMRQHLKVNLALLMLLTSILLIYTYESTLLSGLFLIALTLLRLFKVSSDTVAIRIFLKICLIPFIISVYVGSRSVFHERTFDGASTANLGAFTEVHFLFLLILPFLIFILSCDYFKRFKYIISIVSCFLVFTYLYYSFRLDNSNISYGYLSYAYRALCCFLLLYILSLISIFRFWPELIKSTPIISSNLFLSIVTVLFFSSMSYMMLYHTFGYYNWIKGFEKQAISLKINTPIDKTSINTNHGLTYGYNWGWGNPSLSILLRGNAEAIVLNSSRIHIGLSIDDRGDLPGDFENIRENDLISQKNQLISFTYRLKPFVKNGLLFP